MPALGHLPAFGLATIPSPELASIGKADPGKKPHLATFRLQALSFDAGQACGILTALRDDLAPPGVVLGDDVRFWVVASRLVLELLYQQQFIPALEKKGDCYTALWRPILQAGYSLASIKSRLGPPAQRLNMLAKSMPPVCRALAWDTAFPEPHPLDLLHEYLDHAVDALARKFIPPSLEREVSKYRSTDKKWVNALKNNPLVGPASPALGAFYEQYCAWSKPEGPSAGQSEAFRVCFRLVPPGSGTDDAGGAKPTKTTQHWTLQFLLQAADDPSLLVAAAEVWRKRGSAARFLNRKFDSPQERLLAGLGRASRLFPPVETGLRTAAPEGCQLSVSEAHDFVREKALLLQSSGFGVLVPGLETKVGVRLRLGQKQTGTGLGQGLLNLRTLVDYDWEVSLGDEVISRDEFEALARLKEPLVQIRGRWVEFRPEQIQQALAFFEGQDGDRRMSLSEALKLALAPDAEHGLPIVDVSAAGWVGDLMLQLRNERRSEPAVEPPGFSGRLRPYQKIGVSWLSALRSYGLGACLADDMGLGKTIQLIATLLHQSQQQSDGSRLPALLVCPTSVVGNWRRELARFAPSLLVLVHHGEDRNRNEFVEEALRHDVVISTYALLHRDEAELTSVEWGDVILDEAQNIKNSSTKAAQAARKLQANWRAAMTGTPVENRLADLWSIFQFLNPGYLGSEAEFNKLFAGPIERAHDVSRTERLKSIVSPFILRRVKSDRSVIQDLPEKNEMKVFCTLSKEQATLYEAVVQDALREVDEATGIKRRGMVLAMLTQLKQICDHPALFLHDGSRLAGRSGKLTRLQEMLEEIVSVGDHALIFTQYAEMGKLLKGYLEDELGKEVLFLHGGTPSAERDRLVERFQAGGKGARLFVLSIKAGGTGLNLTKANHVFHFDRWWNPAVENQATDRAFRIGQTRNVQVHKFVCAGTFEEVVDQLIEHKVALSESIVGANETWISEMSTDELRRLFTLHSETAVEE